MWTKESCGKREMMDYRTAETCHFSPGTYYRMNLARAYVRKTSMHLPAEHMDLSTNLILICSIQPSMADKARHDTCVVDVWQVVLLLIHLESEIQHTSKIYGPPQCMHAWINGFAGGAQLTGGAMSCRQRAWQSNSAETMRLILMNLK